MLSEIYTLTHTHTHTYTRTKMISGNRCSDIFCYGKYLVYKNFNVI